MEAQNKPTQNKPKLWPRLRSYRGAGIGLLALAFAVGIVFWGGFNTAMEWTNRETFCISCHEMQENVFKEYQTTVHYTNRTGVRATCPDCHVPKDWAHKMVRKIQASNELYHHFLGSVDTPEKFNAKRLKLAQNEWARMKKTDSRECRNCHNYDYFDYTEQGKRAYTTHQKGFADGLTCIDCHKGIAHSLPPVEQGVGAAKGGAAPSVMHPPASGAEVSGESPNTAQP